MKVLIKGAGDLATGIASRLFNGGYTVMMTEIAVPLTVRRTVALSRAVYDKEAKVENLTGVLVENMEQAREAIAREEIPVIVDEHAEIRREFCPDVVVDAILAKRNLGTRMTDAPLVIGVGPGFEAGTDCDCVVETKRGHTLGNVIKRGSAIPNTGVPGNIGGYTIERLIKASADGIMRPEAAIGDMVEKDQIVAYTGGVPVRALMSGIVRGMLQPDVEVTKGMKIGDIDARCEKAHCYTISDKARAIGGGVLEAVSGFEHRMDKKYAIVVLAAGNSARFGGNKLFAETDGDQMYRHMLKRLREFPEMTRVVVTQYEQIEKEAVDMGMNTVHNSAPEIGISHSLQLGIRECLKVDPEIQGILVTVCDQPRLKADTMAGLIQKAKAHPGRIVCAGYKGKTGNPVVWDRKYFRELLEISGDTGGRQVMQRYPEQIVLLETEPEELWDIDYQKDM